MHIAGEFDIAGVDQVETALARSIDRRTDHVVFDLRELSFLDLCGLQTLVRADRLARAGSCAVHVVPPPAEVARIFSLTPVGRGLEMLDDTPG
jgi:anti-anti-sigma factor